ncbi:MAG: aldo/keto reductase [Deltaproteobacteria bacterium]|nr:aldo/keto reductase [Deltaproteobacteria bacterium]
MPRTPYRVAPLGLSGSFGIDAVSVERAFHELGLSYLFVTPRTPGMIEGIRKLVRAGHRDEIVIASGAHIPFGWGIGREWGRMARLLGVDRIDVFHLFWIQAHWYVTGKTWSEMRRLKEEGKAGALAVSSHDRAMARALVDELGLDVLMVRYNAAHRGAETEVFATLGDDRPAVVSYTATRWGKLLRPASGLGPMTAPECYRFALGHPKVDVVLCGAKSWAEIIDDVAGVAAGPLDPARLEEIKRFGDAVRATARGRVGFGRS